MKIKYFNLIKLFTGLSILVLLSTACNQDDEALSPTRLFRPTLKSDLIAQSNWISATWEKTKGAASYTAELSRDSFKTIDKSVELDTNIVVFDNLLWYTLYQVQVKANASDPVFNSRMAFLGSVKTSKFPTILLSSTSNDFTDYSVVVRWNNSGATVTKVKVEKADGTFVKDVDLNAGDVTAQYKEIIGLTGSTLYKLTIYSGDAIRGYENYMTTAPPQLGNLVIDLRAITGRPGVLNDTLKTSGSGVVIVLRRGEKYDFGTVFTSTAPLNKSLTIMCLPGLGTIATLNCLAENDFQGTIDSLKFINLNITGLKADLTKTNYFLNTTSGLSSLVKKISFENCNISSFGNAVIRLQTGTAPWGIVNNLNVNNCIINDIGNTSSYAVFHAANGAANGNKFDNVVIKNSTCYNFTKGLLINTMASANSVVVENCTFNDLVNASQYFIDFSTTYTVTSLILKNCILGKTKDAILSRGIRASVTSTIDISGTYNTSDFVATTNAINNLLPYSKPSTDLFTDPVNGNFTFKDATFAGKSTSGDPRWKP